MIGSRIPEYWMTTEILLIIPKILYSPYGDDHEYDWESGETSTIFGRIIHPSSFTLQNAGDVPMTHIWAICHPEAKILPYYRMEFDQTVYTITDGPHMIGGVLGDRYQKMRVEGITHGSTSYSYSMVSGEDGVLGSDE